MEKAVIVQCPHCGKKIVVNGLGRPRLNISLKIICESLVTYHSVKAAAEHLNCSEGYIFNALKANRLRLRDVIKQ